MLPTPLINIREDVYMHTHTHTHTHTPPQLITLCESDESVLSKFPCYRNNVAALVPLKVRGREGGKEEEGGGERGREREREGREGGRERKGEGEKEREIERGGGRKREGGKER